MLSSWGGDEVSYGRPPLQTAAQKEPAANWREHMLKEVQLDMSRTHFMGRVPKAQFVKVLQVSAAHVYLTYPFVLSWSLLEAMACGAPIVASDTAPVREVMQDGVNGWLVGFFDVEALAHKVNEVLCTSQEQVGLRAEARRVATAIGLRAAVTGYDRLVRSG